MQFARALAHLRQLSPGMRSKVPGWIQDVEDLVASGEGAEPWRYARWMGCAAFRWASMSPDDLRMAPLAWSFTRGMLGESATSDDAAAQLLNPWVADAWMFDRGGFGQYVRGVAPVGVVDMCPEVRAWARQPVRLLRCVGGDERVDRHVDELGAGAFAIRRVPDCPPATVGGLSVARPLPAPDGHHLLILAAVRCDDTPPARADLATAYGWLGWLGRLTATASDEKAA